MTPGRRCALASAVLVAVAGPIAVGALTVQSQVVAPGGAAQFEVASIRPSQANADVRGPINALEANLARGVLAAAQNGRFRTVGMPLHLLIQLAYDVKDFQIEGGPSWMRSDRYAIEAKAAGNPTPDQLRAMLRSLLADRFHLTLRRETRSLPVFELVRASGGLKIAPMKEGDCITLNATTSPSPVPMDPAKPVYICGGMRRKIVTAPPDRTDRIEAGGIAMAGLIDVISEDLNRVVIDKTGFTAPFNLVLDFAPLRDRALGPSSSGPTISTAVQEQLGLRLQSASGPVDVLVIDRAERPSEN